VRFFTCSRLDAPKWSRPRVGHRQRYQRQLTKGRHG
jgi:hypothetical protein